MRRHIATLLFIFVLVGTIFAQQPAAPKPSAPAKPSATQQPAAPKQGAPANTPEPAKPSAPGLPSEDTMKSFLQHTFGFDPSINYRVMEIKPSRAAGLAEVTVMLSNPQGGQQMSRLFITSDGKFAIAGEMFPFGADPFASTRAELGKGVNGPARGPENATSTIVEFSDLQCPSCKQAQPILDKLLTELKNVRLIWQQFPLPSHNWAAKAAAYGDCLGRSNPAAFWKYVDAVYAAQAEITDANAEAKLKEAVEKSGGAADAVVTCAAQPATAERIQQSIALGRSLDVTGTPTVFVNGRKLSNVAGIPYEVLKKMVEPSAPAPASAAPQAPPSTPPK
jgi:protein-disulfide isomerase